MEQKAIKDILIEVTLRLDKVTGALSVLADGTAEETGDCLIQGSLELVAEYIKENITKQIDDLIDKLPTDADDTYANEAEKDV